MSICTSFLFNQGGPNLRLLHKCVETDTTAIVNIGMVNWSNEPHIGWLKRISVLNPATHSRISREHASHKRDEGEVENESQIGSYQV